MVSPSPLPSSRASAVATAHSSGEPRAASGATRLLARVLLVATVASVVSTICFVVYLLATHIASLKGAPVSPLYTLGLVGLGAAEACQILGSFILLSQWAFLRGGKRTLREPVILLISLIPFMVYVIFLVTLVAYLRARRREHISLRTVEATHKVKEQAVDTIVGAVSDVSSSAAGAGGAQGPVPASATGAQAHATMHQALGRVVGPTTQRNLGGVSNRVVSVVLSSVLLASVSGVGAALTYRGLAPGSGPNIVLDGGFEQPNLNGANIAEYSAGQTFGSWTVSAGSVDLNGSYWVSAHGAQSLDLSGSGVGTVYQDLSTTPGHSYYLSFAYAGNPVCDPPVKQMQVWWGTAMVAAPTFNTSGHGTDQMGWKTLTYTVFASQTKTRLKFVSLTQSYCGPALDNVAVR